MKTRKVIWVGGGTLIICGSKISRNQVDADSEYKTEAAMSNSIYRAIYSSAHRLAEEGLKCHGCN
jgi:hypothetical protein